MQICDVHAEREQAGRHRMAQQMWIDTLSDSGGRGGGANDLADTLACQHVWRWPGTSLTAGEKRPRPSRSDMQP